MAKPLISFKTTFSIPPPWIENQPTIHSTIPLDLVFKILCTLTPDELIKSCRRVCRLWREITHQIPCKFMIPKEYGESATDIKLETMLSVAHQIRWGRVKKFRKVFTQQPKQTTTVVGETPLKKSNSKIKDEGAFDSFINTLPPFTTLVKGNYPLTYEGIRKLYIEIFNNNATINQFKYFHLKRYFLRDVQPLICEDLLLMRFKWANTRSGTASEEAIEGLIVQYETGEIIADSERSLFPEKLLDAFKQYPFLIALEKTRTAWKISLAKNGEILSLEFDFDTQGHKDPPMER